MAGLVYFLAALVHYTSTISYEGEENISNPKQNFIFCHWHQHIPFYFAVFLKPLKTQVWMNHPLWIMKPVHLFLSFVGIKKLIMGSSGNDGKKALNELTEEIKKGASTFIFPDGPAGPAGEIKSGIIDLAHATGVPIIPMEYKHTWFVRLNTWDQKKIPLPFSKISVIYHPPIYVNDGNKNEAKLKLELALNNVQNPQFTTGNSQPSIYNSQLTTHN
jgi:lysophospholipid acyltransferase (LPLAT)-like uncharacterized protein